MATITPTKSFEGGKDGSVEQWLWESLSTIDPDGAPLSKPEWVDRTVQVVGTFGAGGTCVIQGSLDNSNWVTLTDPQGNALSFSGTGLEQISELVKFIRPFVSAGDGTTDLDVYMIIRRPNNMRT